MPALTPAQLAELTMQYNVINDFNERRVFYDLALYPALRDTFVALPGSEPPIELLLLPISNQYLPVLAAARWKPRVAFGLYSSESNKHRASIEAEIRALGLGIRCDGAEILNIEVDPSMLYMAVKAAIKPYLRADATANPQIAVDFTGGTKVMSVAAAMAVSLVGGRFFYVLSATARDDIQQRVVGSEQPRSLDDPYLVFGDLDAAEARRLYKAHDYVGAQRIFAALAARVPPPDGQHYAAAAALSAAYADWEVFSFAAAHTHLAALLELPPVALAEIAAHLDILGQQHAALNRLGAISTTVVRRNAPARQTLADADSMLPLLGTLHAAALRRAAQGRYDFAALFRYRCLELISQHRLASYGILCNRPDYRNTGVSPALLKAQFAAVQQSVRRKDLKKLPERNIALFDGYMLLAALDDPLVRGYAIKQIEERSQARNLSVLAHGYQLIESVEYNAFATVVDEIIDRLFSEVLGRPRADWETIMRFVELPAT